jgi:hypothetical protein
MFALLLVLLITQASSSICGAQCVQHNLRGGSSHGCHAMQKPQGTAVQTCPPAAHTFCAMDMLATQQTTSRVTGQAVLWQPSQLLALNSASVTAAHPPLRSSLGSAPRITPLRV